MQVTDPDQDVSDAADTVKIDLATSSGETLEGFALTETGPHTGIFRGAVPTGIPRPRAYASDSEEAKDPSGVIHPGAGGWVSLADGRKNKWIEVDTMNSHEVSSVTIEVPHLETVKDVALLGMLADDYEELAAWPASMDAAKGGVQIEIAPNSGGETVEQMRRHVKLASSDTFAQEAPALVRESIPYFKGKPDGTWGTMRLHGAFYLGENRSLELKYLQPYEGYGVRCHVLIDEQAVLGHFNQQTSQATSRVDLVKGPHTLELLLNDNHVSDKVVVGFRQPDGSFAGLPAEWFSVQHHPELLEYLRPKGRLSVSGNLLTATFDKPIRLRKVRALFRDFTGTGIAVNRVTINDAAGKAIIPVPAETAAPGPASDRAGRSGDGQIQRCEASVWRFKSCHRQRSIPLIITAPSRWPRNSSRPIRITRKNMSAFPPRPRCRAGDQLMVVVTDYDEDTTDARDTVDVKVTTSSGESLTLKALETYVNHSEEWHAHAGQFLAVLQLWHADQGRHD